MTIPISREKHCDDAIMCQPYFFHWKIEQQVLTVETEVNSDESL